MTTFENDFDSINLTAPSVNEPEIQVAEDRNAIVVDFGLTQLATSVPDSQAEIMDNNGVVDSPEAEWLPLGEPETRKLDGFLFLPSYLESFEALRDGGDSERAYLLLDAIIAYGTQRKRITTDPVVTAVMMSIEKTIDTGAAKRAESLRKKQEQASKRTKRKSPPLD